MFDLNQPFRHKQLVPTTLIPFGFQLIAPNTYQYQTLILTAQFRLIVTLNAQQIITTEVIDLTTDQPYTLYQSNQATGAFVSQVRQAVLTELIAIARNCYQDTTFADATTQSVLDYVAQQYQDQLEFLWTKFPKNAVLRRRATHKWYAALLSVSKRKLGLDSDAIAVVLDVRVAPEQLPTLIDQQHFFPAYHMNKKHWVSVLLDDQTDLEALYQLIDTSYQLAQ